MATKIQWTQETWNPIVGCSKISPGCKNCYAEKMAKRLCAMGQEKYFPVVTPNGWTGKTNFVRSELEKPFRWKNPRMIFVNSMGDTFHETVSFDWIVDIMSVIGATPRHTYMFLTKRPDIMKKFFDSYFVGVTNIIRNNSYSLPNLWIGVTAENQEQADKRIPILLKIPAAKRFVSIEPQLGPVDLTSLKGNAGSYYQVLEPITGCGDSDRPALDWVICGSESGPSRRTFEEEWARTLKNQCVRAGVPFFFKQLYIGNKKISMPTIDGKVYDQIPER